VISRAPNLYIMVSLDISIVDINIARQLLLYEVIYIDFVASNDNLADPFTKNLSGEHINCALKETRLKV